MAGYSSSTVFRLGSLGPFLPHLVSQTTWNPRELEKHVNYNGLNYEYNGGMTDVLFGKHVHHFPVLLVLDVLWRCGSSSRLSEISSATRRSMNSIRLRSRSDCTLSQCGFSGVLQLAHRRRCEWRGFLLSLNMGVFIVLVWRCFEIASVCEESCVRA